MAASPYPDSIDAARRLAPGELIAATFERIRALNPILNAYLEVFEPSSRPVGSASNDEALRGIPIAVKDLFDVAGHRTTAGSSFRNDHVAAEDAFVVAKLRAADAVLTGKTNLHEWALGVTNNNPHFGACRNPWDVDRIPGGSSGGSAAAVAAGLCLGALGSDTGGSIRIPAALCGIVGLKPTRGRISLRGVVPLSWSHDHAGPMARTVRDVARLLQVVAGYDPLDPISVDTPVPDFSAALDRVDLEGIRIGVPTAFFFAEVEDDIAHVVHTAIDVLRHLGAEIVSVDLRDAAAMIDAARVILLSDAAAYHRERIESHPDKFGADVLARLKAGRAFSGSDYALARHARREWRRQLGEVFASVDAIVTPTTPIAATRIDEAEGVSSAGQLTRFTSLFNFAGTPAISVPCGVVSGGEVRHAHVPAASAAPGGARSADRVMLPVGMQIIGRWWDEVTVLRLAHAYEQATEWHARKPQNLPGL